MSNHRFVKSNPKPKLPRKRKKACISSCGRRQYYNTIKLARVTGEENCKFWKDIKEVVEYINGVPLPIPHPINYW